MSTDAQIAKGADALAQRRANTDVTFLYQLNRNCTAPKRGWLRRVG